MSTNHLAPEPRPDALQKAQETVKHLGAEWAPIQAGDTPCNWMAYIHGPDLRCLTFNMGTWRNGRLTILGSMMRLQQKFSDPRIHMPDLGGIVQISVDPFKSGEEIAKDIKRRLMDDYEAAYKLAVEKLETSERHTREREATQAEIIRLTHGRTGKNYPFDVYTQGQTLSIEGADSIRFSHTPTFTLDQMRRLVAALPELFQ